MQGSFLKVIDKGLQALIYTKFKDILEFGSLNKDVVLYPKDVAYREIAEKRGSSVIEFMNLWRQSYSFSWSRQRSSVARTGINLEYYDAEERKKVVNVKSVPVDLSYVAYSWTRDYEKHNKIIELYNFWVHQNPNLDINYNDKYPLELDLIFSEAVDESTVSEKFDVGTMFVLKMPIRVEGWIFVGEEDYEKAIHKIVISIYDEQNEEEPVLMSQEEIEEEE